MENVVNILLKSGHTTSMLLNVKDFRPHACAVQKVWTREDVLNGGFSIRYLKKHLQRLLEQGCLSEVQFYFDTRGITMESTSSCLVIEAVQNTFHNLMWLLLECTCFFFPLIHISSVFFVHRIFCRRDSHLGWPPENWSRLETQSFCVNRKRYTSCHLRCFLLLFFFGLGKLHSC